MASCHGSEFTTTICRWAVPKVEEWHHLKLFHAHCDLCHWFAIYWSGMSSTSFIREAGIRLQNARDTTASLVDTILQKMEFVTTPLRHMAHGSLSELWCTSSRSFGMRTLVLSILTRSPSPSVLAFQSISFSLNCSSDWKMMNTSYAHQVSLGTSCMKLFIRGIPEPWWTVGDSDKRPDEHPLSLWTRDSVCNQHALCFWQCHTCFVWDAPATPSQTCKCPTRWHIGIHDWMPFPNSKRPCTGSY